MMAKIIKWLWEVLETNNNKMDGIDLERIESFKSGFYPTLIQNQSLEV